MNSSMINLSPLRVVQDESGVVGNSIGELLPFHGERPGHVDKILSKLTQGRPGHAFVNDKIYSFEDGMPIEVMPSQISDKSLIWKLVYDLKEAVMDPKLWAKKCTAAASFMMDMTPLPPDVKNAPLGLPSIKGLLDRDDID